MMQSDEEKPFLAGSVDEDFQRTSARRTVSFSRWLNYPLPSSSMVICLMISHFAVFIVTSILWAHLTRHVSSELPQPLVPIDQDSSLDVSRNFTRKAHLLKCGQSTAEAKSLGCRYDILSNHWIPAPCMDQAAVEEYQSDGSWFGFTDENRTDMIDIATMSEMDFYYTSERDHIVHCAMLWRKQFRAFYEERIYVDTLIGSFDHTMHCSQFLIDMSEKGPDWWNIPIKTFVGHAGCWVRDQMTDIAV